MDGPRSGALGGRGPPGPPGPRGTGAEQLAQTLAVSARQQDERMMAAIQAQRAHWMEQQKSLEQRMKLQEERYLQATAPTRVEIIRERIRGPTTHIHPIIAQPEVDIQAQIGKVVVDMQRSLSEQASRHAGDMRESMRQWLSDAHGVWKRPPPTAYVAPNIPPSAPSSSSGLDRSLETVIKRATNSADVVTPHERSAQRSRSRSPRATGESVATTTAVVTQRTKPARVTKPKPIAALKPPKRHGPDLGVVPAAVAPPPDIPPDAPAKKVKKSHSTGGAAPEPSSRPGGARPNPTFDFGGPAPPGNRPAKANMEKWEKRYEERKTPIKKHNLKKKPVSDSRPGGAKEPRPAPPVSTVVPPEPPQKKQRTEQKTRHRQPRRFTIAAI